MYIKNDPYASYKLLRFEFEKIGYTSIEEMTDKGRVVTFTSPTGRDWRTSVSRLAYPFNSSRVMDISVNKDLAYIFAQKANVSIPYTYHVPENHKMMTAEIKTLLESYLKLIVKPADSSLSRGLTLNIETSEQLTEAIARARQVSSEVLVQQQVEGEEVRFVLIDGKVVSALLRRTPRVVGDGTSTICELIKVENDQRKKLHFEYISYPQLTDAMVTQKLLTSSKIPKKDELVELNRATMVRNGCSVYDVMTQVHFSYIESVEALVGKLAAPFIVADVFVKDFSLPLNDHNYWFIEFNTSPVLKLFYGCRDGQPFDIVPKLTRSIDRWLHRP
ncbi:MAG: hypothetical protein ABI716_00515 [Candidatus Saccharibacteria bacterium]